MSPPRQPRGELRPRRRSPPPAGASRRTAAGSQPPPRPPPPSPGAGAVAARPPRLKFAAEDPPGAPPPAPPLPFAFIEHVLTRDEHRLVAECEFDVDRHRFLRDHVFFGRNLSTTDPDHCALPIMPLAVTLEVMAEAAQLLDPTPIRAIRDVRTLRWLAFETPNRRVRP